MVESLEKRINFVKLIWITGSSASGKTTLASWISQYTKIDMISKDDIKVSFFESYGFNTNSEKKRLSCLAESVLHQRIKQCIETNEDVIVDASYSGKKIFYNNEIGHKCEIYWIVCIADPAILASRYNERINSLDRHIALSISNVYPVDVEKTSICPPISIELAEALQDKLYIPPGEHKLIIDTTNIDKMFEVLCWQIIDFCHINRGMT